jgi:glutaredoxin
MRIELYGRPGCHLCDEAAAVLEDARQRFDFELVEHNVDDDPAWRAAYGDDVPVVVIDGRRAFKHRVARRELERYFGRNRS